MSAPRFALVGHPNKGKSSLVSTLARDTSVRIGPEPGTTVAAREFPLRVDGRLLYVLVDTPGFQRARAALDWMKQAEEGAGSRSAVVARFVSEHEHDERFQHECELLRPLVAGAGLIYVVDGATPYGPEYDAEMEILRWTGQPSLAVINPIGVPRFVEPWSRALEQFFRVVRVIDVQRAPFAQQVALLEAFGQMRDAWHRPVEEAVAALTNHRAQQQDDAAQAIAELLGQSLTHRESRDIGKHEDAAPHTAKLEQDYRGKLRQLERRTREAVEAIYGFDDLDREEADMARLDSDLLSRESWLAFGLKKRDLVIAGAAGGAITGGVVDTSFLGASLLMGTMIGGVVGGALGYFSSDKLAEAKVMRQPLGGQRLRYGPTRNTQFPFVLLNRAILHHAVVADRTHAQRDTLRLLGAEAGKGDDDTRAAVTYPDGVTRDLTRVFARLRRAEAGSASRSAAQADLAEIVSRLITSLEGPAPGA